MSLCAGGRVWLKIILLFIPISQPTVKVKPGSESCILLVIKDRDVVGFVVDQPVRDEARVAGTANQASTARQRTLT